MNNYKLLIQYDGTEYSGWQSQQNAKSVQDEISDSISKLLKHKIVLIGSGRTDSGVHALGQVANFKSSAKIDLRKFQYSLNSILPSDISVISVDQVDEFFHSRFTAKSRTYLYVISKRKSPFYKMYSYFYKGNLNVETLNDRSKILIGEKDFSSFCKNHQEVENKVCHIFSVKWKETEDLYLFFIEANRFLHGMVRAIVGLLLHACKNNLTPAQVEEIINLKNRQAAADTVPAKGLFLYKVRY
ncbi:MAG TPA: tRNA pseudouridine(38-40) synthase TruA [Ignavibacteriaceae bacterium]|nr:tRNA pseudouridine(38-40) synthase TruA [Ignavibacteriaceae bacterium]